MLNNPRLRLLGLEQPAPGDKPKILGLKTFALVYALPEKYFTTEQLGKRFLEKSFY